MEALVSKEKRASTSVDTLPGMISRISLPNSTRRRSRVASTCSSRSLPCMEGQPERAKAECCRLFPGYTNVLLAVLDCDILELCVLFLLRRSEDQRRVGRCVLRLVFADGCGERSDGTNVLCNGPPSIPEAIHGCFKTYLQSRLNGSQLRDPASDI